jgi:DNA (cytosine-5)-methyltransferase 3A
MTVLSLFDGMSCGQIALRELGVKYRAYYASEIDPHAIGQALLNFPDTVQLGDVTAWRAWDVDWASVELLLAGSPCQGFSRAGKRLAFDDPRSKLFFEFADILDHVRRRNPRVRFLLENVAMPKRDVRVISERVGVLPVRIESALVSAQLRDRLYWTNIRTRREGLFGELRSDIPQPEDRGIMLEDILEDSVPEKYHLKGKTLERILRENPKLNPDKACCVTAKSNTAGYGNPRTMTVVQLNASRESGGRQPYQQNRVYNAAGKSPAHMAQASFGSYAVLDGKMLRRLTPTECARLQTIPEWYRWACSDTQQYKLTGNGWTVEVIKHILSNFEC